MPRRIITKFLLLSTVLLCLTPNGRSCNIPVFRYALELWAAEPYDLFVFHRNNLTRNDLNLLSSLQPTTPSATASAPLANLRLTSTDVSTLANPSPENARIANIWNAQTNATLPWLVLVAPDIADTAPVWTGPLTQPHVRAIVDSPARQLISQRLLQGESAVWILLESGNPSVDNILSQNLTTHLAHAQSELQLPPPAPDDPKLQSNLPLRIAFSTLRISRNDPAETVFVQTLINGEPSLMSGAVAFPVFGQGRTLAAFHGRDLTQRVVQEACAFMTGPCSCEVKELSPGKDLLFAANWTSIFNDSTPAQTPPTPTPDNSSPVARNLLITASALAGLIAAGALLLLRRRPRAA